MGVVWSARNIDLDSAVAIKLLSSEVDHPEMHERLLVEARSAAKLAHPAIVNVFDIGETASGEPFIVMELLRGNSLGAMLALHGRIAAVQAVALLLPIADALSFAHQRGIVHRDVKPDNIFIVEDEGFCRPKLVDFGIVKVQRTENTHHLTRAGTIMGSPDYLSPEQARGDEDIDHLADVWALSVVLYEMISGRLPFSAGNYNALLWQIAQETPPSLLDLAAADRELAALVARGLNKSRRERVSSMEEMGQALAAWLSKQGVGQDICGNALERKWLRSAAKSERRASAITDEWREELRSGIAIKPLVGLPTLPAPPPTPQVKEIVAPERLAGQEGSAIVRSKLWLALGLAGLALSWFANRAPITTPRLKAAVTIAAATAVVPAPPSAVWQPTRPLAEAVSTTVATAQSAAHVQAASKNVIAAPSSSGAPAAPSRRLVTRLKRGASPVSGKRPDLVDPY
jgi:eukaryotic-like serine/threonine-protein kinase